MDKQVSKESKIKNKQKKLDKQNGSSKQTTEPSRNAASQPIIRFRRQNKRLNKRFIITFAIWIIALIAAFYFLSRL
jgi:hypothetical protein